MIDLYHHLLANLSDYGTAFFQFAAAWFLGLSVRRTWLDWEIKGVSVGMIGFFSVWGYWGIYFMWSHGFFWGTVSAIVLALEYSVWWSMAVAIKHQKRTP